MSQEPLIHIEGVAVVFRGAAALSDITIRLEPEGHLALTGDNGAGKSTLLRLMRGEIYPTEGRVFWRTPEGMSPAPLAGRALTALVSAAQMEQYSRSAWRITGEEVLLTGLSDSSLLYTEPTDEERARALELAEQFGITPFLHQEIGGLSQGQLCLLLLGRACMRSPAVLLLDEFTNALDVQGRRRVLAILEQIAARTTLVVATHRRGLLPAAVSREATLEGGRIVYDGAPRPNRAASAGEIPAPGRVGVPGETASSETASSPAPPETATANATPPLIDIRHADVFVERTPVLHGINWVIQPGEHWAVLGANGSGKSTLLRLLAGEEYPADGGSITRHDPLGQQVRDQHALRRGVRLLSDRLQATYAYDVTGLELVLSGFEASIGLYREYSPEEITEARQRIQDVTATPAENLENRAIRTLSTGQLRRLLLARALVGEPYLLLLDEPFSGLDEATRRHIRDILSRIARQGVHIIMVSHHAEDLPSCIRHTLRLVDGRIAE